jgi:hypothetical protein
MDSRSECCTRCRRKRPLGCTVSFQLAASNNTAGAGTLSTGSATFELQLVDSTGTVLGTATIPLYIIDGPLESPPVGPGTNAVVVKEKARIPSL